MNTAFASPLISKLCALSLALIAVSGLWSLVAQPYLDSLDQKKALLISKQVQVAKLKDFISASQTSLAVKQNTAWHSLLWQGSSASLISAQIQTLLRGKAAPHKIELLSIATAPEKELGPFKAITLHLELRGEITDIATYLSSLEQNLPHLEIQELNLSKLNLLTAQTKDYRLPLTLRLELVAPYLSKMEDKT